jgi:predicted ATPase
VSKQTAKPKNVGFTSLTLRDFTCFREASFEFVPGVNVFVGENGTGKTHVMKVLYSVILPESVAGTRDFAKTLLRVMPAERQADIVRHTSEEQVAWVQCDHDEFRFDGRIESAIPVGVLSTEQGERRNRPVFIPATDMIGHTRKFTNFWDEYNLDFDYTFRDIAHLLEIERRVPAEQYRELVRQLEDDVLHGSVEFDAKEDRFFLVRNGNREPMPLVAEGLRKIATLLVLLRNGSIKSGTTLFWDEPEVNLNPALMDEVVGAIMTLARSGVQVFLATHSYVILKEIDLAMNASDSVKFFSFYTGGGATSISSSSDFASLRPNPILDQYDWMMVRDMAKADEALPEQAGIPL